jgi:hypothetical protein
LLSDNDPSINLRASIPDTPEDTRLALREADQARTDFAAIESDLEFLMQRVNRLPTGVTGELKTNGKVRRARPK